MSEGVIPTKNAFARIVKATKHFEQTHINPGLREEKVVRARRAGGCSPRNEIWQLTIFGTPTGGSLDLGVNVLGTTETITLDFDMTDAEVQTEFEGHSEIGAGNVECSGGPFPDSAILVEFIDDLANHAFPVPAIDFSGLTGGSGVAAIAICYHGHPTDGSVAP